MSTRHHRFREIGERPEFLSIGGETQAYDWFVQAGSPGVAVTSILTVQSGIIVKGQITGTKAAIYMSSAFPAGSVLVLINYGYICGFSGEGGRGGEWNEGSQIGLAGGNAIELASDVSIDNKGFIFGGGSGGWGGAGNGDSFYQVGGGGGGAGQGTEDAPGGVKGSHNVGAGPAAGAIGTFAGPGLGGHAGEGGALFASSSPGDDGAAWGDTLGPAQAYAVMLNGKTVTWVSGYNATQVKGRVA